MNIEIKKCYAANGWFFGYYVTRNGLTTLGGVQPTPQQAYKKFRSQERQGERNMNILFK